MVRWNAFIWLLWVCHIAPSESAPFLACYCFFGPVSDLGWTYQHNLARAWADSELGVRSKYVENFNFISRGEQDAIVKKLVTQDLCDIVFTGSGAFTFATLDWAEEYRNTKTKFFNLGGSVPPPLVKDNMGASVIKIYQGCYIAGVLAAMQRVSATGLPVKHIGYVGSTYMADSILCVNAFYLGAQSTNPQIKMTLVHVGGWYAPRNERIATLRLIKTRGVEVIDYDSDSLTTVRIATAESAMSFGMKSDGAALVGELTLASQIMVWNEIIVDAVALARDTNASRWQSLKDANMFVGFEKRAVSMGTFSSLLDEDSRRIATELQENLTKAKDDIFCRPGGFASVAVCPDGANKGSPFSFGGTPPAVIFPCAPPAAGSADCLSDAEKLSMTWLLDGIEDLGLMEIPDACMPGQYEDALSAAVCLNCSAGRYSDARDQTACKECPLGYYSASEGATACEPCPLGTFASEYASLSCSECPAGKYSDGVASECSKCPAGSFRSEPGGKTLNACELCSLNSFANTSGQSSCTDCSTGLGTAAIASKSVDDCICLEGTYRPSGASAATCLACPGAIFCPIGSSEDNMRRDVEPKPRVLPRHWSSKQIPLVAFVCESEKACPGGPPESCATGLQGRACHMCADGFTWNGLTCAACSSVETSRILFPTFPVLVFLPCFIFMYSRFADPLLQWGSWRNGVMVAFFVALNYLQLVSLSLSTNVAFPSDVISTGVDFTTDAFALLSMACAGYGSFEAGFVARSLLPLLVAVGTVFLYLGARGLARVLGKPALNMDPNRMFSVLMSGMFTFFSVVTTLSCSLFRCSKNPNSVPEYAESLMIDLGVVCYTDARWQSMLFVGIAAVLLYCVGCGVMYARAIAIAPKRFHDEGWRMRWKFLFIKYRNDAWWFSLVYLLKNLLLQCAFVISTDGVFQLLIIMAVMAGYSGAVIFMMPYRHRVANAVEILVGFSVMLLIPMLMWFADHGDPAFDRSIMGFAIAISFVPLGIAACPVVHMVMKNISQSWTDAQRSRLHAQLLESSIAFAASPAKDRDRFLRHLGEWDLWHLRHFDEIVQSELQRAPRALARLMSLPAQSDEDALPYKIRRELSNQPDLVHFAELPERILQPPEELPGQVLQPQEELPERVLQPQKVSLKSTTPSSVAPAVVGASSGDAGFADLMKLGFDEVGQEAAMGSEEARLQRPGSFAAVRPVFWAE